MNAPRVAGDGGGSREAETLKQGRAPAPPPGPRLLIIGPDQTQAVRLPGPGSYLIGRGKEAEISLDDPSVSRRHARLVVGPVCSVEDLGSANGTTLRDRRLPPGEPTAYSPGEPIEIGDVSLLLEPDRASHGRLRRVLPHGAFEARLESECARAERTGGGLIVGRLSLPSGADDATALLTAELRADEAGAAYGPGELEFLLVDSEEARADALVSRLLERAGGPARARVGLAFFGRHGRTPEQLLAHACAQVRRAPARADGTPGAPIVADPAMRELYRLISKVAAGSISVLVLGETGVGKELIAEAVHRASARARGALVRLNCAALSEALIESELFGHEKGAFTGAVAAKPGLLETAQGGTLFLDEVGELPLATQVKLLRVLEERRVRRVGALEARPIDVRLVSATNRDLEAEIAAGRFRQDLYFRLNGISLHVPPLRERPAEIAGLAAHFVRAVCAQEGRPEPEISRDALLHLERYAWPGNIRELKNVMERAVLLAEDQILPMHLPLEKMAPTALSRTPPTTEALDGSLELEPELEAVERRRILEALERAQGNQTQAAKLLGIARRTLIKRLDRYKIERPRKEYDEG